MQECPVCGFCAHDAVQACLHDGVALTASLPGPPVLDGKYRIEWRLGRGGMGTVYRARHLALDRLFAVKLIQRTHAQDNAYLRYFQEEALALGRLRHRGIVGVTDFGVDPRDEGIPYLVMDFLEGQNLAERLQEPPRLTPDQALAILEQVAEAVDYAHTQGVLHRDIKPGNILLTSSPSGEPVAKVLDFGLAQLLEGPEHEWNIRAEVEPPMLSIDAGQDAIETVALSASSAPVEGNAPGPWSGHPVDSWCTSHPAPPVAAGTPAYMAPEILDGGRPTRSVDVYALGVSMFEVLVGRLPFEGSTQEVLHHQVRTPPPRPSQMNPRISPAVEEVLLALLHKDPAQRPASLRAATSRLREALSWDRLNRWKAAEVPRRLGMAILLALVAGGLGMVLPMTALVDRWEHRVQDVCLGLATVRPADPRILLVTLEDSMLDDGTSNFFATPDALVAGIDSFFQRGAAGVGVDMVLPRRYQHSESLSRLVLEHQGHLAFGLEALPGGQLKGWEWLPTIVRTQFASPQELADQFGLVNLEADTDGRVRHFNPEFSAEDGTRLKPLAGRVAAWAGPPAPPRASIPIDQRIDPGTFRHISWRELTQRTDDGQHPLQGVTVLIGVGMDTGEDIHVSPGRFGEPRKVTGLSLHAMMLQTLWEGAPIQRLPSWIGALSAGILGGLAGWGLLRFTRPTPALWAIGCMASLLAAVPVILGLRGFLAPTAAPIMAFLSVCLMAFLLRIFLPPIPPSPANERQP